MFQNQFMGMKWILCTLALILCSAEIVLSQDRFKTSQGEIRFNASTPLEDIDALNKEVNAIIDVNKGKFAVVMLIKEFAFERKLMQEHFNENYMESDKFPKATFSGTFDSLEFDEIEDQFTERMVTGNLTIHGITKPLKAKVRLKKTSAEQIYMVSSFQVRPEDHEIEVPRIVFKKIAQEVEVSVSLNLSSE